MTDFFLSEQDKASGLWLRLAAYFEARLLAARKRNDAVQPDADTALLRGEIRVLKGLMALGADRPMTGDEQPLDF